MIPGPTQVHTPNGISISSSILVSKHTHPFNGPLSGTTRVGQYQKGKTNLDFTEARDSEWQWHQMGHMHYASLHLAPGRQSCQHSTAQFYRPDALPATQPTVSKH